MARCARRTCRRWRPDALVRHGRVGVTFNGSWYCSTHCLEIEAQCLLNEVRHQDRWVPPPPHPVGRLLAQRQGISTETLEAALRAQRHSGRRLGAELVAMGAVSGEDVLRALAAQAGIGYLPSLQTERVALGPGGLSRATVRTLRVVPFDASADQQRLMVACAGPLPRMALAALRDMTGWRVEPFLVPETVLERLINEYGRDRDEDEGPRQVRSLPEAAASIARAAERGTARRMQHVRCDPYVWVRLEGQLHVEDLMVSLEHPQEERPWQVAPTPH